MNYFDTIKFENIQIEAGEGFDPFVAGASINAEGETYYNFQKTITTKYTCVIHAASGRVRYACEDASAIAPGIGERVFGTNELPADFFDFDFSYWQFDGEQFVVWQLTREEQIAAAERTKQRLLAEASAVISPLQDVADVGEATDEDAAKLLAWKKYRLSVSRVDTGNPVWPDRLHLL